MSKSMDSILVECESLRVVVGNLVCVLRSENSKCGGVFRLLFTYFCKKTSSLILEFDYTSEARNH